MNASVQFEESTHTYRVGGRRMPSVTQVLRPLYGDLKFVSDDLLQYKGELGQAVHRACELYSLDRLDPSSVVDPVLPYFRQFLRFIDETCFKPIDSEVLVHSALGYAGKFDLVGLLHKRRAIIDIKTTSVISPAVGLQTVAYQRAYNEGRPVTEHAEARYALRLTPDDYRLVPFKGDAADFAAFVAFLKVHQWCIANNKTVELPQ